ncbi:MAG: DUF1244 domain-containing protein [Albidovulum sp.]|nr:DUF1244 domain-containing protein [Albidovulum sp.]MDE0307252.1 DUF1244 domain-containing protein [Albidovulum sp.]MDE0532275.1 DUF1244 domain-containing protein [Albidovulum sp.]
MDENSEIELQAAAFRRLRDHLRKRTDVQNIDLMNLGGFCRNCLSRWYMEAARTRGLDLTESESRKAIYGMPYEEWKKNYQTEATAEQIAIFELTENGDD